MANKAIFLDRDGVINKERKDYVKNIHEFEMINGVSDAIKNFKKKGYLVIIITNQSAINRHLLSVETLDQIHSYLQELLKSNDISIDAFYYCPHLPEENCICRKPKPGLLLQAASDFDIDFTKSYFIGDRITDSEAAIAVSCKYFLLDDKQTLLEISTRL